MKHTIDVYDIPKEYVPNGIVSFEIDDKDKYSFDTYGMGEVTIANENLKSLSKKMSNGFIVLVCEYPYCDDEWYFGLDLWYEDKSDYDFVNTYSIKEQLPNSVKNNIAEQLCKESYVEKEELIKFQEKLKGVK